jgi:AraC family transcriptional regulator
MYVESLCVLGTVELTLYQRRHGGLAGRRPGRLTARRIRRIEDYVESHLGADIGLDELASEAGLSRYYFVRAFRKSTGETPYQYLLRRRIERAQLLLRQENFTVTQVARAVGFRNTSRFIRTFLRHVGTTPGSLR